MMRWLIALCFLVVSLGLFALLLTIWYSIEKKRMRRKVELEKIRAQAVKNYRIAMGVDFSDVPIMASYIEQNELLAFLSYRELESAKTEPLKKNYTFEEFSKEVGKSSKMTMRLFYETMVLINELSKNTRPVSYYLHRLKMRFSFFIYKVKTFFEAIIYVLYGSRKSDAPFMGTLTLKSFIDFTTNNKKLINTLRDSTKLAPVNHEPLNSFSDSNVAV